MQLQRQPDGPPRGPKPEPSPRPVPGSQLLRHVGSLGRSPSLSTASRLEGRVLVRIKLADGLTEQLQEPLPGFRVELLLVLRLEDLEVPLNVRGELQVLLE